MKKVSTVLTLAMLLMAISTSQAHSSEGIFTVISTGDGYTQTNALVLSASFIL